MNVVDLGFGGQILVSITTHSRISVKTRLFSLFTYKLDPNNDKNVVDTILVFVRAPLKRITVCRHLLK